MLSESYLLDAGWLFFVAWSVVVGAVSIAAFGRDLIPFRSTIKHVQEPTKTQHP